ncbi:hypothetical protein [Nocardia sp. NPDC004415]
MSYEIYIGKQSVKYYPRWCDDVGENPSVNGRGIDLKYYLSNSVTVRRIDAKFASGAVLPEFLHWSDGTNLDYLDHLLTEHEPHEKYVDGALVGTDVPLRCQHCDARFVGIVVDPSLAFADDMLSRYRNHHYVDTCPACGHRWRADILDLI